MYKQLRKITAIALAAIMLFSILPLNVLAALITTDYSGGVSLRSIIPSDPPVATRIYEFKVDGVAVDTQIIKNGEYLTEPQAPEKADHRFVGWFAGEEKLSFGPLNPINFSASENIEVIARFEPIYYVFFMDGVGSATTPAKVFRTKEGATGDSISTEDVILPLGSTQAVTGWYKDQGLTDGPVGANFTIGTSNQQLWPKIETGNYITFVSGNQGTYVAPQFVAPGANTQEPTVTMTRPGYTFKHWSATNAENGSRYTFNAPITANLTLYAVWQKNQNTPYTVVFWKQSVNDNKNTSDIGKTYDFAESEVRYAATEGNVYPKPADAGKNYTGFHFNNNKSVIMQSDVKVKGDGTTILNIYYDRNLLTINFQQDNTYDYTDIQIIRGRWAKPAVTPEGYEWYQRVWVTGTTWDHYYVRVISNDFQYTGLYGQTFAQNGYTWPADIEWFEYYNGKLETRVTFLDAFIFDDLNASQTNYPKDTLTLKNEGGESGSYRIRHYKQNLDGTYPAIEDNVNKAGGGTFYFTNKYPGFTVAFYRSGDSGTYTSTSPGGSVYYGYNNLYIRHTRNTYTLTFHNHNATAKVESVLYEDSLSGLAGYIPPKPAGLGDIYEFQGWYKDNGTFTQPFIFEWETMPANNLVIYAKWAPPVIRATVYQSMAPAASSAVNTLEYNKPIDPSILPAVKDSLGNVILAGNPNIPAVVVPADHEWIGWTTKNNGVYTTFNFDTLLTDNIELHPYYVSVVGYSVTYDKNGGTGDVTDNRTYAHGAYADVQPGTITPPTPANQVFLGWTLEGDTSGKIYVANEKIFMDGDKNLIAAFGPKLQISLTYKANGGDGADYTVSPLMNNQLHTVRDPADIGISRPGYTFVGWSAYAVIAGAWFYPGDNIIVDNNPSPDNVLYARWYPNFNVTASKVWNLPAPDIAKPAIWFTLYRNDPSNPTATPVQVGQPESVPTSATASVTWSDLPQVDNRGRTYTYSVKETNANGEDYTPPSFTKTEDDANVPNKNYFTITNKYEYIDFTVTKVWAGEHLPTVKPTIQVQLQVSKDGGQSYVNQGAPVTMTDGTTTQTWYNLPKQNDDYQNLSYRAVEVRATAPESYEINEVNTLDENGVCTGTTITNTYQSVDYTVTKNWAVQEGLSRPAQWPEINIQLYQKQQNQPAQPYLAYKHVEAQAADMYTYTWEGLPKFDTDGNDYTYFTRELVVPKQYHAHYDDSVANNTTITNTLRKDSITGVKHWDGEAPPLGMTVDLQLWQTIKNPTGAPYSSYRVTYGNPETVSETNNWQYTWTNLPVQGTYNGQTVDYEYEISETAVPTGYYYDATSSASLYVTNVSEKICFTATKLWQNGENHRPASVRLYLERRVANSTDEWVRVPGTDYDLLSTETQKHTWTGLDNYQDWNTRKKYEYRVREEKPENYTPTYPDNNTVLNTYDPPTRTVTVTKVWKGGLVSGEHPAPDLTLWRRFLDDSVQRIDISQTSTSEYSNKSVDKVVTGDPSLPGGFIQTTYTYTIEGLADREANGNKLLYGFTETPAANYEMTVSEGHHYNLGGTYYVLPGGTITNTYTSPKTAELWATKQWVNGPDADHTRVRLTPWRTADNGQTMEEVEWFLAGNNLPPGQTTALNITGAWKNLAATDFNGRPYTYYFTEDKNHPDNARLVNYADPVYSDYITVNNVQYGTNGATVTNTYVPPKTGIATAYKRWINGNSSDHQPVAMQLWRSLDSGATMEEVTADMHGGVPAVEAVTGSTGVFKYTWSGLECTDHDGVPYTFYFTESAALPEGYSLSYSASTNGYGNNGAVAYNTYTPPTADITAKKIWVNGPESDHIPAMLGLYRKIENGEMKPVGAIPTSVSPSQDRTEYLYTWTQQDTTDINGNAYTYYVKEDVLPNYTRTYSEPYNNDSDYGLAGTGTSVTNTYVPPTDTVTGSKTWLYGRQDLRPVVYMRLYYSTDPNGVGMVPMPDFDPILLDSNTDM